MARPADPNAREALIAAARAEFQRRGLRGARIEDITAACGLSKGAFYLHFESKEALFKTLVDAFLAEMGRCSTERVQAVQAFTAEHGPLHADDFREGTEKFRRWDALELAMDLRTLEGLWQFRDVADVLMAGSQGTPFEGTMWALVDAEIARIAQNCREFQCAGCLRSDVAPELFGAMVVGTYLLVSKQMARTAEKPDLGLMARSLQMLIREGSLARATPPQQERDESLVRESHVRTSLTSSRKKQGNGTRNGETNRTKGVTKNGTSNGTTRTARRTAAVRSSR